MDILLENHPDLRKECVLFDFEDNQLDIFKLEDDLLKVASYHKAIGLAAPQIGVLTRVFVFTHDYKYTLAINPNILALSEESILQEEGCLSYPGLFIKIKRPRMAYVSFYDTNNNLKEIELKGYEARGFIHEYDHLNGVLMLDNLSSLRRNMAKKKWQKIRKHFI